MKPSSTGPITVNGIHPINANMVKSFGTTGSETKPAQGTVAAMGAKTDTSGQHIAKPVEAKPSLTANQGAETKNTGKSIADIMYPPKT